MNDSSKQSNGQDHGIDNGGKIHISADESKNINISIQKSTEAQQVNIDDEDAMSEEELKKDVDDWNEGIDWENQNQEIDFDFKSEKYYRISWRQLCRQAHTNKAEDVLFMDRLILRVRYVHERKEKEKNEYFKKEKQIIKSAFVTAVLNALRMYHFNDLINLWKGEVLNIILDGILNITCVAISAYTVWLNSQLFLKSPKETWLRHMSFYFQITLEADRLFAGANDYKGLSAMEKIKKFKEKTVVYTSEDYQNFFANMSGTKDSSKNVVDKDASGKNA